jgi:hypothetical protein
MVSGEEVERIHFPIGVREPGTPGSLLGTYH